MEIRDGAVETGEVFCRSFFGRILKAVIDDLFACSKRVRIHIRALPAG